LVDRFLLVLQGVIEDPVLGRGGNVGLCRGSFSGRGSIWPFAGARILREPLVHAVQQVVWWCLM